MTRDMQSKAVLRLTGPRGQRAPGRPCAALRLAPVAGNARYAIQGGRDLALIAFTPPPQKSYPRTNKHFRSTCRRSGVRDQRSGGTSSPRSAPRHLCSKIKQALGAHKCLKFLPTSITPHTIIDAAQSGGGEALITTYPTAQNDGMKPSAKTSGVEKMKNFNASTISRKKLLGGTALVAVAAALTAVSVTGSANAQATTRQVSINSEWRGSTGNLRSR